VSDAWYYADRSERIGPVTASALKAKLAGMPNAAGVYVWTAGFTDWKRAGDIPELWGGGAAPPPPFAPGGATMAAASSGAYAASSSGPYVQPNLVQIWFGFSGRINRAKLWLVSLVNTAIVSVFAGVAYAIGTIGWVILGLLYIAVLVSGLGIVIRRLHDRNKSGWWALIFYAVPIALSLVGFGISHAIEGGVGQAINGVFSLISLGFYIWAFVELGCLRGTVGDNRFGPDPLTGKDV